LKSHRRQGLFCDLVPTTFPFRLQASEAPSSRLISGYRVRVPATNCTCSAIQAFSGAHRLMKRPEPVAPEEPGPQRLASTSSFPQPTASSQIARRKSSLAATPGMPSSPNRAVSAPSPTMLSGRGINPIRSSKSRYMQRNTWGDQINSAAHSPIKPSSAMFGSGASGALASRKTRSRFRPEVRPWASGSSGRLG